MKWIFPVLSLLLTAGLVFVLNTKIGKVPPFGKFLNPFGGFWANAEPAEEAEEKLSLPDLREEVTVLFDDNHVPHIFAQNNHDLYYAQGYLTARDRLWQMELQTLDAAGRTSEIIGEPTLERDRYTRRRGMVPAAKAALQAMMADPTTREVLEAYSGGVNAYIASLSSAEYPIEYKLLDYAPEPWEPLKSALLLKQMATTLATGEDDARMSNILEKFGPEATRNLFPDYPFRESPIIPVGTKWTAPPAPEGRGSPLPTSPEGEGVLTPPPSDGVGGRPLGVDPFDFQEAREIGSNNWALHGSKTATGYPMLANDPHLDLTLPSIWYQIQLHGPDVNVCGASLPGAPGVISGFNERIAWGVTNVGSDVMDWYRIKFADAAKSQYVHGGKNLPVKRVVEVIKVRGKPDFTDTVLYTHHGPIVYDEGMKPYNGRTPVGCAMRWIAQEPSNELATFYGLNRAKNYADYTEALKHYVSPAQNFVFASADNDVAIWPNGKFPLKWKEQGKFLLDGSDPAHDWQGWIPQAQNPHVLNPPRGFVSSANQFSADTTYPYYLGWEFAYYARGERINQRLTAMQRATPDSLRMLQNDNYNIAARDVLAQLLSHVSQNQLSGEQMEAYQVIAKWDKMNNPEAVGPTIFTLWWNYFTERLWDEFASTPDKPMRFPNRDRTVHLIVNEPTSPWTDLQSTTQKESLADICTQSFRMTIDTLTAKRGAMQPDTWAWGKYKDTQIPHLSRNIPGFGRRDIWIGGGANIVNATGTSNGPSWRMVVALGPQVKAYGLYPGGQSGNPGSPYYDNMVDKWAKGELPELVFLQKPDEKNPRIKSRWVLGK